MIPARFAPALFGLLSGLMSLIVPGVATARALGPEAGLLGRRLGAWLPGRAVAFPTVLMVAPLVGRLTAPRAAP
jgi:hypothetical protein